MLATAAGFAFCCFFLLLRRDLGCTAWVGRRLTEGSAHYFQRCARIRQHQFDLHAGYDVASCRSVSSLRRSAARLARCAPPSASTTKPTEGAKKSTM
jgi:hypothetical protein